MKSSKPFKISFKSVLSVILLIIVAIFIFILTRKLHTFSESDHQDSKLTRTNTLGLVESSKLQNVQLMTNNNNDRLKIAFAITITKDGSFQDGAAILAYSIHKAKMTISHDVSLVAFIHPNVTLSRSTLQHIGYHVIEVPTPIK